MATIRKLIMLGLVLCLEEAHSYKIIPLPKLAGFSDVNYDVALQTHTYEGYSQQRIVSIETQFSKCFRLRKSNLAVKANSMDSGGGVAPESELLGSGSVVFAGIVGFFMLKTLLQSLLPLALVVGTLAIVGELASTKSNQADKPKFRYSEQSRIISTQEALLKTPASTHTSASFSTMPDDSAEELWKVVQTSNMEKKHYATRVQNAISRMQQRLTAQSEDMAQLHSRIEQTQERVHHLGSSASSRSAAEQQTKDSISETLQKMERRKAAGKRRSGILSRINRSTT